MKCRAMQALYLLALTPVAETTADPNSYGFRTARGASDAMEACFIALCQSNRAEWIFEGDIRSCFDRISHEWLLTHIPLEKAMLKKWLKAGYVERRCFHPTEDGTPQGGIISPAIANMTLDGLEPLLASHVSKTSREGKRAKVNVIRYADDVRHLTQDEILLAEKGGTEEYGLRVISPTWNRKAKGKGACEKRGKRVKALMRCPARPA
jgi:RNA-directed DNA polymerase